MKKHPVIQCSTCKFCLLNKMTGKMQCCYWTGPSFVYEPLPGDVCNHWEAIE